MSKFFSGIGTKIIFPYLLLTLIVAGVGAFIVVNLVTSTLQERFNNQLLDAGRVVAESMVGYEADRLSTLRQVVFTEGVAEAVAEDDYQQLLERVPQIIINSPTDAVILLDPNGREIFAWINNNTPAGGEAFAGADLSSLEDVQLVLQGFEDEYGDKRAFLAETSQGPMLFTVGPLYDGEELVGAALIGTDLRNMAIGLTENAVTRVTLYLPDGSVVATTLGDGRASVSELLREPPAQYETVLQLLQESPEQYQVISENAALKVPLSQVEVLNQDYQLAFGEWRLRNESYGLFSVALPSNFIVNAAALSRNLLNFVFTVATLAVITIGFLVARLIVRPLNRLVDVTSAVTEGDLKQRTGISRNDEIGTLAVSFDTMTERLDERNQQLVAQKSELAAILHSIADGVVVLDTEDTIVNSNPAAQQLLSDLSEGFAQGTLHELLNGETTALPAGGYGDQTKRYEMNGRVLSASSAQVQTPTGDPIGTVMVLRDISREAEAENLKDDFITGMSHELRTPLTVVKVYTDLLQKTANGHLDGPQYTYLQKIAKAGHELEQHIQKMISITELQAGTLSLKKEVLDVNEQLTAVTDQWQQRMADKGITFVVQLPDKPVCVNGDADRLQWAVANLVSNAYNYTPAAGTVQIMATVKEPLLTVDVIDDGIGIAQADQPYIFNRFFRAKNDINFSERGIGLGLYITRELITLHDGTITVNSKTGRGSTFRFTLPVVPEAVKAV